MSRQLRHKDIYLISKKGLIQFAQKAQKDPIVKGLLEEIQKQNLRLFHFSSSKFRMSAILSDKKGILISDWIFKKFLEGEINLSKIWLGLSHELAHLRQIPLIRKTRKECGKFKQCLYLEVCATKKGYRLLEKISDEPIEKLIPKDILLADFIHSAISHCRKCIALGIARGQCPRVKELKEMGFEAHYEENTLKINIPSNFYL